jgi:Sulfotransferase family
VNGDRGPGPHFFCIGPAKSATTWIADHLKLHTDVWLPPVQEVSYLNAGFGHLRGTEHLAVQWDWWSVVKRVVRNKSLSARRDREFYEVARRLAELPASEMDLDLYRELFAPAGGKITGDISPAYASFSVEEIERVRPVLDGARIFLVARDPVQRFWSRLSMHYRYRTFGDVDYGSVEVARQLFHDPGRSRQHFLSEVVGRWRAGIGEDRLKIFYFDDIVARPVEAFRAIVDYIGADYRKRIPLVSPGFNRQGRTEKAGFSPEAREWVRLAFQPELRACAELFGPYGRKWLDRHSRSGAG